MNAKLALVFYSFSPLLRIHTCGNAYTYNLHNFYSICNLHGKVELQYKLGIISRVIVWLMYPFIRIRVVKKKLQYLVEHSIDFMRLKKIIINYKTNDELHKENDMYRCILFLIKVVLVMLEEEMKGYPILRKILTCFNGV